MRPDEKALARWRAALAPYRRDAPPAVAGRSALLVVDVQGLFRGMCQPILPALGRAVRGARRRRVTVIFTQHGHADPARDGGMLAEWWSDLIREGSDDHALLEVPGVEPGETVVAKRRYDAFHGTDLERRLREGRIEDLAVAGVMTNLCVETTARSAFVRDFRVRVLMDATATADEALHLAALTNLAYGFAYIQTVGEWLASLD